MAPASTHGGRRPGSGRPPGSTVLSQHERWSIGTLCDEFQRRIAERRARSMRDPTLRSLQAAAQSAAWRIWRADRRGLTAEVSRQRTILKAKSAKIDLQLGGKERSSRLLPFRSPRLATLELRRPKDSRTKIIKVAGRAWNAATRRWNRAHPKDEKKPGISERMVETCWKEWRRTQSRLAKTLPATCLIPTTRTWARRAKIDSGFAKSPRRCVCDAGVRPNESRATASPLRSRLEGHGSECLQAAHGGDRRGRIGLAAGSREARRSQLCRDLAQ